MLEPGNYWNTLGFASFDLPAADKNPQFLPADKSTQFPAVDFHYVDIDTTTAALGAAVNTTASALPTAGGSAVGALIDATEAALGLNR